VSALHSKQSFVETQTHALHQPFDTITTATLKFFSMNRLTRRFLVVALLNALNSYGQSNNACSNNEEIAILEIQFDQNADETGYNLVCDDVTIWDVPIGALKDQPAGAWKIERSCIRSDITLCNFTIFDEGRDGITGSENGFFSLSYGATTVAYLDYGKAAPFAENSFCFGIGCDSPAIEQMEDDAIKDGWKKVDFNDTTVPTSDSPVPGDGSDFNASGVWVVNVTKINKDENDRGDSGHWVVNVTVIKKEDDPTIEPSVTPTPNDKAVPNTNDQTMSKSESHSPSTSSLAIIAGVIGSILLGVLILFILYKRGYCGRDTSNDTVGAALPYTHNTSGINNKNKDGNDDDDDEKSKNSNHNDKVQPAETFVTYDSTDTTVVQAV
jgi:hypothetical protein